MTEPGQPPPWNQPPPPYDAQQPAYGARPPPQGYAPPYAQGPPRADDTVWGVLAHLSIFGFGLIAPLVIYLVFKDSSPFIRGHAAEALNFHLTLLLATMVSIPLTAVLIGIPMLLAIFIVGIVLGICAAMAASRREPYRYASTIHFVS